MPEFGSSQLRYKMTAALYVSLAVALAIVAWYHYLLGHYDQILWPALSSPFIMAVALIRFFLPQEGRDFTPYPVLLLLSLILFNSGPIYDPLYRQWLCMMPVLTYFILPVRQASISLLLFFILFVLFAVEQINQAIVIDLALSLALFSGISFLFAYSQESQTQTLERLSGKDSLTGAFIASQLDKRLMAEVSRAKVTHRPLSVLMIDLGALEELIQRRGDGYSRSLLLKAVRMIHNISRTGDEIYRLSEYRFLLLLPNTSINGGIVLKERMLQKLAEHPDLAAVVQDLPLNPATLQASESSQQFLERALRDDTLHAKS